MVGREHELWQGEGKRRGSRAGQVALQVAGTESGSACRLESARSERAAAAEWLRAESAGRSAYVRATGQACTGATGQTRAGEEAVTSSAAARRGAFTRVAH